MVADAGGADETVSDPLCRFIAGSRYEDLPATTIEAAKRSLLDAIGVIGAASGLSADVAPFRDLARGSSGPCTVLGFGDTTSAAMAAFANGAMAHALDFEDAFDAAPCHPNASLVPAAIAIAQSSGPVSGRDFLTAVAVGCDLVCRLGLSLRQPLEEGGWYPPPILGAFGATAAAARLLGLGPERVRDALSLTLCQVTAPGEIKHSRDTVVRAVREAFPAQAAVLSALLARGGVRGFERPLEGRGGFYRLYAAGRYDRRALLDDLGRRFYIEQVSFKPWPACRGTHAYIELALELMQSQRLDWRSIDRVDLGIAEIHRMLAEPVERKRSPQTVIDAKFSLFFTVALALVRGRVTLDDFAAAALPDADLRALATRVHARVRPDWGRDRAAAGQLSITLRDGRALSGEVAQARGSPAAPLSTAALVDKFVDCCGRAARPLGSVAARALAARILAIDELDDAGSLFRP
jgi:2-methylcitrate dehydratase PrpD